MATRTRYQAGEDRPVASGSDQMVISSVRAAQKEAEDARRSRDLKSQRNLRTYLGEQDWTGKQPGQSREFLPKTAIAVEQMSSFIKKALTEFDDWFKVELGMNARGLPLTATDIQEILKIYMSKLPTMGTKKTTFAVIMADVVKLGLLESLMIVKVHGYEAKERTFLAEPGETSILEDGSYEQAPDRLVSHEIRPWRLRIDPIDTRDYYPDPTGRGLYEIHRVEVDLHHLISMAEAGLYDEKAVEAVIGTTQQREGPPSRSSFERNQDESSQSYRKPVVITEYWGTLLNSDGTVARENIVTAVANDRFLIRPPEDNPFWHQESPFVASPLLRVPNSVWHKAVYDDASPLNLALNELFNLMLDGAIASVWGVRQVRKDVLANPQDIAGGIPQGKTLVVNNNLPVGAKAVEQVTEGSVPNESLAMMEVLSREYSSAAMSSELKMGSLPQRKVLATEIIEQSQSQAVTLEGVIGTVEDDFIERVLQKSWLCLLQNADGLPVAEMISAIGEKGAMVMARMSPAQRFAMFAGKGSFKVIGLSQTMARMKDFQKTMALLQAAGVNPMIFESMQRRHSSDKILDLLMKQLNINPRDLERDEVEQAQQPQQLQSVLQLAQGLGGRGSAPSISGGGSQIPADINQLGNPATTAVQNS